MSKSAQDTLFDDRSPLPEDDAILLSSYLDGELTREERAGLERRLESEPMLKEELEILSAEHKMILAADPTRKSEQLPISRGFSSFENRLATAAPGELPIAQALKPPRLRRLVSLLAAILFAFVLLAILNEAGTPARTVSWKIRKLTGKGFIYRRSSKIDLTLNDRIRSGDRLELLPAGRTTLGGPHDLACTLTGPAVLEILDNGRLHLLRGRASVTAPNPKAVRALAFSTPDGNLLPKDESEEVHFEVHVPGKSGNANERE